MERKAHEYDAITITPVTIADHPSTPEGELKIIPLKEGQTAVGCRVCGMGYDEAHDLPCPGRNFADMIEELTEGM